MRRGKDVDDDDFGGILTAPERGQQLPSAIGGGIGGLDEARDAASDGVRKLAAALRHRSDGGGANIAVIGAFTSAQLDLALGRSNVIHAALLAGPESETFLARVARLERFRNDGREDRGGATKNPENWERNG